MLNIKIYKGVPFQQNYNNVILFNSITDIETYLLTYYVGEFSNVAMYYANENKITLNKYYEDANYIEIEDTNAVRQKKFYFIDNMTFKSASAVEYNLICDIWTTYIFDLTFKPSLLISGHVDVFNSSYYRNKIVSLNAPKFADASDTITNLLIEPYENLTNVLVLALIKTANGTQILYHSCPKEDAQMYIELLSNNNYYSGTLQTTYEILKVYLIPNFDFTAFLVSQYEHAGSFGGYADVHINNPQGTTMQLMQLYYNYYETIEGTSYLRLAYFKFILDYEIASDTIFDTTKLSLARYNKKILVGVMNNTQEIDTFTDNNPVMKLKFYLISNKQIEIMFETMNIKINLTSSFEVPFVNDEYILYMNQNQNQIDVGNKQNAVNYALTLLGATAGGVMKGGAIGLAGAVMGAGVATANYFVKEEATNARLADMKNTLDRLDGINNNCVLMLQYGIGAFTIIYDDSTIVKQFERFGSDTQIIVNDFKPSNVSNFNFNYVQFQSVNLYGNFAQNIKTTFENIFNKGVRIWHNASVFLNDVNHGRS